MCSNQVSKPLLRKSVSAMIDKDPDVGVTEWFKELLLSKKFATSLMPRVPNLTVGYYYVTTQILYSKCFCGLYLL